MTLKNRYTELNESLPFKNCNDDELKIILSVNNNSITNPKETMTTRKMLAQTLPFQIG